MNSTSGYAIVFSKLSQKVAFIASIIKYHLLITPKKGKKGRYQSTQGMSILSGDLTFIKTVPTLLTNVISDNSRNINNKGLSKKMYKFIDFLENSASSSFALERT